MLQQWTNWPNVLVRNVNKTDMTSLCVLVVAYVIERVASIDSSSISYGFRLVFTMFSLTIDIDTLRLSKLRQLEFAIITESGSLNEAWSKPK